MRTFKVAFWAFFTLAILVVSVAIIGQNNEPLSVTLFNHTTNTYPKWVVLLACVLTGAILTTLFFLIELIVLETKNVRLRRTALRLERALVAAVGTKPAPTREEEV